MTPERARELLGGLAAGILTPEEKNTLFEAALHDQTLFNEVAGELELGAFLQSPDTRAQLANRIEVEPERRAWWRLRPAWLALSGVLAASVVAFVAVWPRHVTVEELRPQATIASPAPQADQPPMGATEFRDEALSQKKKQPAPFEMAKQIPAVGLREEPRQPESAPSSPSPPPPPPAAMARKDVAPPLVVNVHDATGAAVAGASVDVVNSETQSTTHSVTDARGRSVTPALPQGGAYTVIAQASGFKKEERPVTIAGNQTQQIDIPLALGEAAQTATVVGAPGQAFRQNLNNVAVLNFANGESGAHVADLVANNLSNGGQVRVIDRDKVQKASLNKSGRTPSAQEAAALGRSVGADTVIVGSVAGSGGIGAGRALAKSKVANNVSVTAEVIDTKEAKPTVMLSADGPSLQVAADSLGSQIQSKLFNSVEGKVTRFDGDLVSIAFTNPPNLQAGARCEVFRGARKIGELVLTSVNGESASGKFTGTISRAMATA